MLNHLKIKPEVYTRFKDDIKIVTESLEQGSKLTEDKKTVVDDGKRVLD